MRALLIAASIAFLAPLPLFFRGGEPTAAPSSPAAVEPMQAAQPAQQPPVGFTHPQSMEMCTSRYERPAGVPGWVLWATYPPGPQPDGTYIRMEDVVATMPPNRGVIRCQNPSSWNLRPGDPVEVWYRMP